MRSEILWAARHVLACRTRRRALRSLGIRGIAQLARFLLSVVPKAHDALEVIESRALMIEDPAFRGEALSSIRGKSYHVAGGSIFATFLRKRQADAFIAIIAPLESLYDYLDNLCDRHPGVPKEAYPILHEALHDALDPHRDLHDYFRAGPASNDGGYLAYLVRQTRAALQRVPDYNMLLPYLHEAAEYYTALQTYKHYPAESRVAALQAWHAANLPRFKELAWWEFAAACGSQFHVYVLFFFCLQGNADFALQAYDAYFPHLCGLHVLLDDFIDQAEDAEHGELNFVTRYESFEALKSRFALLMHAAQRRIAGFKKPQPHRMLIGILTLFYLTHPKIYAQNLDIQAQELLEAFA